MSFLRSVKAPARLVAVLLGACAALGTPSPATAKTPPPPTPAPTAPRPIAPEPGATVQGFIDKGETAVHTVHLEKGDYLEAHLDRDRYKVEFRLYPPGDPSEVKAIGWGELCADPPGQTLWGLADETGDYRLTVKLYPKGSPGPYEITLLELHPAGDAELARQEGEVEWEAAGKASGAGEHQKALDHLTRTLELWKEADYLRGVAATHGSLSRELSALRRFEEAATHARKAGDHWAEAGDTRGVVASLIALSNAESRQNHWEEAEHSADEAVRVARQASLPTSLGHALTTLCGIRREEGDTEEALATCGEAVAHWESQGDPLNATAALKELGIMHRRMGEFALAQADYDRILTILRDQPWPSVEAQTHSNLGTLYFSLGEYQKALVEYQTSLEMYRSTGEDLQIAEKYYNIGTVYQRMGRLQDTLEYYERARQIQQGADKKDFRTTENLVYTLLGIGWVYVLRDDIDQAVEPMSQALRLSRESGVKPLLILALRRMATLRLAQQRPEDAYDLTTEGLELARETQNRWEEAALLDRRASAEEATGQLAGALETLRKASRINDQIGNRRDLALNEYQRAQIHRKRGEVGPALQDTKRALEASEEARGQIGAQEIRSLFGATQQEIHSFLIDLLMELHARDRSGDFAEQAFEAAEGARARSLLEILSIAHLDTQRQVPEALVAERKAIRQKLVAAEQRRVLWLDHANDHDPNELFQLKLQLDRLTTELAEVERKMRAASPAYAELTRPEATTVDRVQHELLDPDTALLEFRLGEERSFLFLVTPDSFRTFELPAREVLEEDARCIHWLLAAFADTKDKKTTERTVCLGPRSEELERLAASNPFQARSRRRVLIEQALAERSTMLGERLLGKASRAGLLDGKRLAVVSDGALEYVPFAALTDPGTGRPLIVGHELVSLPSASVLAFQRNEDRSAEASDRTLAVIADPLYGRTDERIATATQSAGGLRAGSDTTHYERLPYATEEARSIAALAPPDQTLVELGSAATKEAVLGSALEGYRYIHFAVHGVLDTDFPALSRLVLSQLDAAGRPVEDGSLRLHDIYDMQLDAQMVVLSACDTALGQEIRGEGLVGLARGFMYAGAQRVVASLWRVQDRATATLMERFYQGLLKEHRAPADALRRAQLAMLSDGDEHLAFPYYWAGFVLQGDWR